MKSLFTSVACMFLLVYANNSFAQNCVVDTNNVQMISPESDSLPCVERNTPYQGVIQFFCPPQIAGIDIYSIEVTGFSGLPSGITSACTPSNCTLNPWDRACVLFSGTTTDSAGDYPITYSGMAYTAQGNASFSWLQQQGVLPEYYLKVIDQGEPCREIVDTTTTGISNLNEVKFNVFPNPSKGNLVIDLVKFETGYITITDLVGREVYRAEFTNTGRLYADLSKEAKGVYLVRVNTAAGVAVKRVSID
jgi:hypothetical protein